MHRISALFLCTLAFGASAALADNQAVINLAGVVLQDATNQSRSSSPDDISPGFGYTYQITGTARGTSGLLQILFPSATSLATILDTLQPGASAALVGEVYNPTGAHPIQILNQPFSGSQTILGTQVTFAATLSAGIGADNFAYFSITNVSMLPNTGFIRLGALQIVSGTATITRNPAVAGDMNWDGVFNNFDIDAFVLAIVDPAAYTTLYGDSPIFPGDLNRDGLFNNFDIDPFVALLVN